MDKHQQEDLRTLYRGRFFYDKADGWITINGSFVMTGSNLAYLTCVLNNPVTSWYFGKYCISSGMGTNQCRELYVRELLIPDISQEGQQPFIDLVDQIIRLKKADPAADTSALEAEIDRRVYDLYGLTPDEIDVVEGRHAGGAA